MEYAQLLVVPWEAEQAEKARKEAEKRQKFVLGLWKKFYSGLKIVQRMKDEYGEEVELPQKDLYAPVEKKEDTEWDVFQKYQGKDFEGGFVREGAGGGGFLTEEVPEARRSVHEDDDDTAGGFFVASQEEVRHGDLTIDHGDREKQSHTPAAEGAYRTPISLTAAVDLPDDADKSRSDSGDEDANAQDTKTDETEEDSDEDDKPLLPPTRSTAKSPKRTQRTPKPTAKRTRKAILDSADEKSLSDALSDPPSPLSTAIRSAPKRKAARKSDAQVKSHFFAMGSEDETDATDRSSPKKGKGGRGGKARGSGRGKGRGRQKA